MYSTQNRSSSTPRGHLLVTALALVLTLGSTTMAYAGSEPADTAVEPPETTAEATIAAEPTTSDAVPTIEPTAADPSETTTEPPATTTEPPADDEPAATTPEPATTTTTTEPSLPVTAFDAPTALTPAALAEDDGGGGIVLFDHGPTAQIIKTAAVPGGGAVQPGSEFAYQIYVACTSTELDCVGFVFTDVIPDDLEVVQLPQSNSTRTVAYDPGTRTLTMTYNIPTDNPPGTGWTSGSNEAFDIVVRLPANTPLETGDEITNEGVVTMEGVEHGRDDATVEVEIPVAVTPVASKQWPGGNVVAGSDATTTATIGAANASSTSAEVTSLAVVDTSAATWEHFDLTSVTVAALPLGATQAQLFVCTEPASVCGDGDWIAGGTAGGPGPLTLPGGVAAGDVTGVRVVFTAGGAPLPRAPQDGGSIQLGLQLRDTFRSNDETIAPDAPITVSNCATATASEDDGDPVTSAPSCVNKQILSSTVAVTTTKVWVPDTDGNWQQDTGEFAVAGAESPVTARVRATNQSPFPIHQITIVEPSGSGTTDFADFDVDRIRLTFPSGATEARVQVTYADSTTTDTTYGSAQTVDLDASASQVTSVTVTYTGGTAEEPAIANGATAGLDLHGRLTDDVDAPATLANCADVTATGADGTTPDSERPCGNLPVQAPNVSGTGVKTSSQTNIPADQPVTFTMRVTNNGNLALVNPVVTDPADPMASPNPFDVLTLVSATATTNQPGSPPLTIEVLSGGTWQPYNAGSIPSDVSGVRVRVGGELAPTRFVQLTITVERRDGVDEDINVQNCFGAEIDNGGGSSLTLGSGACVTVTTDEADGDAALTKDITADELPEWTPGLARQETGVTLRVANTGNLSARYLQITDEDEDFFDAVDFVRFGTMTAPAGANRLQIDALVGGVWVDGTPAVVGSPTLPGGVTAAQVRGLRFTFSSTDTTTNGGFVLPPCAGGVAAGCAGVVRFDISPRPALVSDPGTPPTSPLFDTATGAYLTNVDGGVPQPIDPDTDDLELVPGDPRIDVDKGPNSTVLGPGSFATQTIAVTNNGTTALTDVSLVDALPNGLAFDELFAGPDGPYTVAVSTLPDGYEPAPNPTFELTRDGERVESVRWTFEGWAMPPNATITISFRIGLEPGVTTGQTITNTMGATGSGGGPGSSLACTPPDVAVNGDQRFGAGVYCTDPANTSVIAGAAFQARKWVAGNPALGWWHPTLGFVPTGDGNCPSTEVGGKLYTATPCVALVDRGGQYDYVLRVVNAGTEAAIRMALIDNLPHQGDSGLIGGLARGTEWNNRPTLAGPATYSGPGSATIGYSSAAPGAWCTDDLVLGGPGCADGWGDGAGSSTTALRLIADFAEDPLNPGAGIEIRFAMNVPAVIDQDSEVTIAWNSFAHAEATRTALGGERILPPIEPIKVGVSPLLPDEPPPTTTTPTTVPAPTTTTPPDAPPTTVPAPTTTAGASPPVTSPDPSTTLAPSITGVLPRTGTDTFVVVWLAAGLLALGVVAVMLRRRPAAPG